MRLNVNICADRVLLIRVPLLGVSLLAQCLVLLVASA
jgi:hypothetical protein